MKTRIEIRDAWNDPLHPLRIALYVVIAIAIVVPLQERFLILAGWGNKASPVFDQLPAAYPAMLAGGIEFAEGRRESLGASTRGVWSPQVSTALVALLVAYVIGPAMLVWGLMARGRYRRHVAVRGGATSIAFALAFGGALVVTLLPEPVYAIVGTRRIASLSRDQRFIEKCEGLESELYAMARKAQVRYYRSGGARGVGHSWLAGGRPGAPAVRIADLIEHPDVQLSADTMTMHIGPMTFTLSIDRADSLTIRGTVPFEGAERLPEPPAWLPHTIAAVAGVTPLTVNLKEEDGDMQ